MERDRQLRNVAFGGDWSEAIVPRETLQDAIAVLQHAAERSRDNDPRSPAADAALAVVRRLTRGGLLADAYLRAASIQNRDLRQQALMRCMRQIASAAGTAAR